MISLEEWMASHGAELAAAIDSRRDMICDTVSRRLAENFPQLCYEIDRPDAEAYQQAAFQKTPLRFHKLLQAALRFNALGVVEREYQWSFRLMARSGVEPHHMLAQARWYFEAMRDHVPAQNGDGPYLQLLQETVLLLIRRSIEQRATRDRTMAASRPRRPSR